MTGLHAGFGVVMVTLAIATVSIYPTALPCTTSATAALGFLIFGALAIGFRDLRRAIGASVRVRIEAR